MKATDTSNTYRFKTRYATPKGNVFVLNNGIGETEEQAKINSIHFENHVGYANYVISKYRNCVKSPMLVVGSNHFIRENMPFFVVQDYDIHVFFYPNGGAAWVVECVAISKKCKNMKPVWSRYSGKAIENTVKRALWGIIPKLAKPEETQTPIEFLTQRWLLHWIYRCSKISFKDILSVEQYKEEFPKERAEEPKPPIQVFSK